MDRLFSDGHFDINVGFDADVGDEPDGLGWGVEIDDALVDSQLESVELGNLNNYRNKIVRPIRSSHE